MRVKLYENDLKNLIKLYATEELKVRGDVELGHKTTAKNDYYHEREIIATIRARIDVANITAVGEIELNQDEVYGIIRKYFDINQYKIDNLKIDYENGDQRDPGYYYAIVEVKTNERRRGLI